MRRSKRFSIKWALLATTSIAVSWCFPGCGGGGAAPAQPAEQSPANLGSSQPVDAGQTRGDGTPPAAAANATTEVASTSQVTAVAASVPVYLDDLKEAEFSCGPPNVLAKHGATGLESHNSITKVRMRGMVQTHALAMHAKQSGTAHASYNLRGEYQIFKAHAGILEPVAGDGLEIVRSRNWQGKAASPLTFKVLGDGRLLWQSRPIENSGDWEECEVNIGGVDVLRLEVFCPGLSHSAWSAWAQPRVLAQPAAGAQHLALTRKGTDAPSVPLNSATPSAVTPVTPEPAIGSSKSTLDRPSGDDASTLASAGQAISPAPGTLKELLATRNQPLPPLVADDGPVKRSFSVPTIGGWAMSSDGRLLVVSIPNQAELVYIDTTTDRELFRTKVPLQPGPLAMQQETLFVGGVGASAIHSWNVKTGKQGRSFRLPGAPARDLACHFEGGPLFAATDDGEIVAIDPASGDSAKTGANGMFVEVRSDGGLHLFAGTNRPFKEYFDILRTRTRDGATRYEFRFGVEAASVLKYRVKGLGLELVDANPNAALGAGGYLHVSPDGKQYAMVAGGGWQSLKDPTRRHNIAVFSTEDMNAMLGGVKCGSPQSIAYHPVLNLGAALGNNRDLYIFDSQTLLDRQRRTVHSSGSINFWYNMLTFGGHGTRVITVQGTALQSIPLELTDTERDALKTAYGDLPAPPLRLFDLKGDRSDWVVRGIETKARWDEKYDYQIARYPQELSGGVFLFRPRSKSLKWIDGAQPLQLTDDCLVCVAIMHESLGKTLVTEAEFNQLAAEGWQPLEDEFETTTSDKEVWKWKLVAKAYPRGSADLGIKSTINDSFKIFMFR